MVIGNYQVAVSQFDYNVFCARRYCRKNSLTTGAKAAAESICV